MIATAPASPRVKRKTRRVSAAPKRGGHFSLPFPMPSPGQSMMVGLGDWETYLLLDKLCEGRGMRARFHRGIIEIMSISFPHESLKGQIGQFVRTFCHEHEIDYNAWGSTTQRIEGVMAGEPDDSFSFGAEMKVQPDLFIEVALSSGGIDKLDFWSELKATEVWIWQNQKLHAFVLQNGAYRPVKTSHVLPNIPLSLIEEFAENKPHSQAIRDFQARVRELK